MCQRSGYRSGSSTTTTTAAASQMPVLGCSIRSLSLILGKLTSEQRSDVNFFLTRGNLFSCLHKGRATSGNILACGRLKVALYEMWEVVVVTVWLSDNVLNVKIDVLAVTFPRNSFCPRKNVDDGEYTRVV